MTDTRPDSKLHSRPDVSPPENSGARNKRFSLVLRIIGALWGVCLLLAAVLMLMGNDGPDGSLSATQEQKTLQPAPYNGVRAPLSHNGPVYEEALGGALETMVKRVDYALVQNMVVLDLEPESLKLDEVAMRRSDEGPYHHQKLTVMLQGGPEEFLSSLQASLRQWAEGAELLEHNGTVWAIAVLGKPTHQLTLQQQGTKEAQGAGDADQEPPPAAAETEGAPGKLAIVIDDLGEDPVFAAHLAALHIPVTFSVWPQASNSRETALVAYESGREVLLHQPMEPEGYPKVRPGPGALFVTMTAEEIERVIDANLDLVPYAVGMNNHMGSKFTQHHAEVKAALRRLKERGMFVLDSLTHPGSKVVRVAGELNMPALRRDVFLDVAPHEKAVLHQLEKAARIAAKHGRAIAIGHPFPATLAALQIWQSRVPAGVQVVPLSDLTDATRKLAQAVRNSS